MHGKFSTRITDIAKSLRQIGVFFEIFPIFSTLKVKNKLLKCKYKEYFSLQEYEFDRYKKILEAMDHSLLTEELLEYCPELKEISTDISKLEYRVQFLRKVKFFL